jgi:hypothetical protein
MFLNSNFKFILYNKYKLCLLLQQIIGKNQGGGGIITPVDSTKVIRGVGLKSIGSIPTSELLNLTDNSANTVLSIVGNTATGSCDNAVNKHKAMTISATGTNNGLSVDSNQVLTLSSATTTTSGSMSSADKGKLDNILTARCRGYNNPGLFLSTPGTEYTGIITDIDYIYSMSWNSTNKTITIQNTGDYFINFQIMGIGGPTNNRYVRIAVIKNNTQILGNHGNAPPRITEASNTYFTVSCSGIVQLNANDILTTSAACGDAGGVSINGSSVFAGYQTNISIMQIA